MEMFDDIYLLDLYCIQCERKTTTTNGWYHWLHEDEDNTDRCFGPFTSCPPPEEGGFLLASDADLEQEEPEPTYEDVHDAQIIDDFFLHHFDDYVEY